MLALRSLRSLILLLLLLIAATPLVLTDYNLDRDTGMALVDQDVDKLKRPQMVDGLLGLVFTLSPAIVLVGFWVASVDGPHCVLKTLYQERLARAPPLV